MAAEPAPLALPVPTIALAIETPVQAVKVTVGVPAGTERLDISRVGPSGTVAYVRQGYAMVIASAPTTVVLRDFEVPFGVPMTYTATVYKADGSQAASASAVPITVTPPSLDPWLTDLTRPLNSQPVTVEKLDPMAYEQPLGLHRVLERRSPVVTADLAWTPNAELVFVTLDGDSGIKARDALGNGVPVLLRTLPEQGPGNMYLIMTGWSIARVSRVATRPERRFSCQAVQIDRPDPRVYKPRPPLTYATLLTKYGTYPAVKAAGTYDQVLYDYAAGTSGAVAPWPPRDV
jgi:hypothetical protein